MDAVGGERLRQRLIVPVIGPALQRWPFEGIADIGIVGRGASFDQADAAGRILAEAAGDRTTRRSRTDDQDVEMAPWRAQAAASPALERSMMRRCTRSRWARMAASAASGSRAAMASAMR